MMFNLELSKLGVFHWCNIFIILSLDDNDLYLPYLDFPTMHRTDNLRMIARDFITQYYKIGNHSVYLPFISDSAKTLFETTYSSLIEKFGIYETEQICSWGNKLNLNRDLENSLHALRGDLFVPLSRKKTMLHDRLINIFPEKYNKIIKIIRTYLSKERKLSDTIQMHQARQSSWEETLYVMYNLRPKPAETSKTPYEDYLKFSPVIILPVMLSRQLIKNTLIDIAKIIDIDGIKYLDQELEETRSKKDAKLPESQYLTILEMVQVFQ